jgi:hypothetical protein
MKTQTINFAKVIDIRAHRAVVTARHRQHPTSSGEWTDLT